MESNGVRPISEGLHDLVEDPSFATSHHTTMRSFTRSDWHTLCLLWGRNRMLWPFGRRYADSAFLPFRVPTVNTHLHSRACEYTCKFLALVLTIAARCATISHPEDDTASCATRIRRPLAPLLAPRLLNGEHVRTSHAHPLLDMSVLLKVMCRLAQ